VKIVDRGRPVYPKVESRLLDGSTFSSMPGAHMLLFNSCRAGWTPSGTRHVRLDEGHPFSLEVASELVVELHGLLVGEIGCLFPGVQNEFLLVRLQASNHFLEIWYLHAEKTWFVAMRYF